MIEIRAPRYRDRVVLLAKFRLTRGQDVDVKILHGKYKGYYHVPSDVICQSPVEPMNTKRGGQITMRAVPLDKMERVAQ